MISMSLSRGSHEPATLHAPPKAFGMAPIMVKPLTIVNDYCTITHVYRGLKDGCFPFIDYDPIKSTLRGVTI